MVPPCAFFDSDRVVQVQGGEHPQPWIAFGLVFAEDLIGTSVFAIAGFSGGVPPQLPGAGLEKKLVAAAEGFQVEELGFDSFVQRFDVGLMIFLSRRDATVLGANALLDGVGESTIALAGACGAGVFVSCVGWVGW